MGDYRGEEYEAFAHIIGPGQRDSETFTIHNQSDGEIQARVKATTFKLIGVHDYSFTSLDQSLDHGSSTTPDYAFRIDKDVPEETDLLQVRVTKPYEQFDPDENLQEPFNNWRVHLQNWTDLDEDGRFWEDRNGNNKVDLLFDQEGNAVGSEMDDKEHIRFTYGYNTGPMQQVRMADPLERKEDGLLLTFRHRDQAPEVPTTDLTVEASFWEKTRWSWVKTPENLTVPAGGSLDFDAAIKAPKGTPYGMYEGAIEVIYENDEDETDDDDNGGDNTDDNSDAYTVTIPVTVAVAADGSSFEFGSTNLDNRRKEDDDDEEEDSLDRRAQLYDNGRLFGYTDYAWRADSGDWRFFWTDIAADDLPDSGDSFLVVDTAWRNAGTDIDTIVLGPTPDEFSDVSDGNPGIYGPYTLAEVGRSENKYTGSGRWLYQTSSGGSREIISAPAQAGLHGIALHQVRVDGDTLDEPFSGSVGLVNLDPGKVTGTGDGSAEITISSEIALSSFVAEGFGLGSPETTVESVFQDDPNDPSTASFITTVDIDHGGLLEVSTGNSNNGSDIDLYLYDPNDSLIASSTTPTDEERVEISFPEDGVYTIAVHGWSVSTGLDTFDLTVNAVQGYDLTVTDLPEMIPAGGVGSVSVEWDTAGLSPGTAYGLVNIGTNEAAGLFSVPVEVLIG